MTANDLHAGVRVERVDAPPRSLRSLASAALSRVQAETRPSAWAFIGLLAEPVISHLESRRLDLGLVGLRTVAEQVADVRAQLGQAAGRLDQGGSAMSGNTGED